MLYGMLTGRIGKDGDLRFLATGTAVLSISVATDTGFGERKKTVWVKCSVWGKRAESLAPYIKKGSEISLVGELSESEWTDGQGVSKKNLGMNVTEVQLIGGKPVQNSQQSNAPQSERQAPQQQAPTMPDTSQFQDDLEPPF